MLLLTPLHCYQVLLLVRHVVNAIIRSIALLVMLLVCHVAGVGVGPIDVIGSSCC